MTPFAPIAKEMFALNCSSVFGESETRIYFNGEHVHTGPASESNGGTNFVIGNVGDTNHLDFFLGKIRSVRISDGERYEANFVPAEQFDADDSAILLYTGNKMNGDNVVDLSGNENHGTWQTFKP